MKAALRLVLAAVCGAALCQAQLARRPYLQDVRSNRATVLWAALQNGQGVVQYSTDRSFSRSASARVREFLPSQTGFLFTYYQYEAELTGLNPGTEYSYRVLVNGQVLDSGEDMRFRTSAPGPFSFLAFGDSGQGTAQQFQLSGLILRERPAMVVHTGDIAYFQGTFQQFDANYFGFYLPLMQRAPFFPCPGNHEYGEDRPNNLFPYLSLHSPPTEGVPPPERGRYYSYDWGNVHFISLDANDPLVNAANGTGGMLDWLERDLQNSRDFWRVVYWHQPPYASGRNDGDPLSALARQRIVPILERHGVELVLNGHEHSYQRTCAIRNSACVSSGGTVYITTGGGGASLYEVRPHPLVVFGRSIHHYMRGEAQGTRLTLRAIDINGQEFDSVTLAPSPAISVDSTVNAASFTPAVAPGALVSVFGRYLAGEDAFASRLPLPTGPMAGATVTLNGRPLPLLYVSPNQINAQLPFDVQGQAPLRVTTPNGFSETTILISETAPAIFSAQTERGTIAAVIHANGTLVTPAAPAETGEVVSVYLTGLGRVNGEITAGQASPPLTARVPVVAQLGAASVNPSYAGLAPGFAGLYQVNLTVPTELPTGTHKLRISAKENLSNTVDLSVRSTVR